MRVALVTNGWLPPAGYRGVPIVNVLAGGVVSSGSYSFSVMTGKMPGVAGTMILLNVTKNFTWPPELPAPVLCGTPAQSPSMTVSLGVWVIVPLKTLAKAQHWRGDDEHGGSSASKA